MEVYFRDLGVCFRCLSIDKTGHMKSLTKSKYSYLFVSYIPKDLSNHFGGKIKFRVSLKSVIFSESQRLSQSLRIVMERIYDEIRKDMKSSLTIEDVKDILRKEIKQSLFVVISPPNVRIIL